MFEYCKIILLKVSFCKFLFEKEFKKALGFLLPEEIDSFIHWTQNNFGDQYQDIINEIIKHLK